MPVDAIPTSLIRGFLKPFYTDERTGQVAFEDTTEGKASFEKIRLGYACGNGRCLAEFTTYLVRCPVCGFTRDVTTDVGEARADWQDYYKEAQGPGEATVARTADEAIRELMASPDIDHIRLRGERG